MRLFFAIEMPREIRANLYEATKAVRQKYPGLKWSHPDGWHITLKFLGECPAPLPDVIVKTMAPILENIPTININGDGFGFFHRHGQAHVFHVRIQPTDDMQKCAQALNDHLEPLGIKTDPHLLRPHITLLRIKNSDPELTQDLQNIPFPEIHFTSSHISLMQSILKPSGARYHCAHRF